jgi:hypothetical protein
MPAESARWVKWTLITSPSPPAAVAGFLIWTPAAPRRMMGGMRKLPKAKTPRAAADAPPRDPNLPHWLLADQRWDALPEEIRQAAPRILAPAYRRFVLDAPDELERSVGLSLVHLMWLELCGQLQMTEATADPTSLAAVLQNPDDLIDRHLRLVATKCQTTELLAKLRIMREMFDRQPAALDALPAPPVFNPQPPNPNPITTVAIPEFPIPAPSIDEPESV